MKSVYVCLTVSVNVTLQEKKSTVRANMHIKSLILDFIFLNEIILDAFFSSVRNLVQVFILSHAYTSFCCIHLHIAQAPLTRTVQ